MTLIPQYVHIHDDIKFVRRVGMRVLYTDASWNHGVSGWAVVENGKCIQQGWHRGLTSTMAEGTAIVEALKLLDGGPAVILTDCLMWVRALYSKAGIKRKAEKKILAEICGMLKPDTLVVWVPGHSGSILGNELADDYARQARVNQSSSISACTEISFSDVDNAEMDSRLICE